MQLLPSLSPRRKVRGLALIAVLMLVSLLSVLAVGVVESVRRHSQLVQRSVERLQMQESADSALRIRLLELSASTPGSSPSMSAGAEPTTVLGVTVSLQSEMETGRVDLNTADHDLLMAVFAASDFSADQASSFAERIIDWRDADDLQTEHGAERTEYQRAGRFDGPRNGPFESVSEVRRVLGLENLSAEVLDAFTVYSHLGEVRQSAAPPVVTRALQWADRKKLGGRQWLDRDGGTSQLAASRSNPAGELLRLTACVDSQGQRLCRVAIVRMTGDAQRPTQVFRWETAGAGEWTAGSRGSST
jgi:general secretion pathway protein K